MPALHPDLARLLGKGVSIHVGARSASGEPQLARAIALRLMSDHRLALLIPAISGRDLLRAVGEVPLVAAVFCQPTTHHTVQIKGREAVVAQAVPEDWSHRARYKQSFVDEIRPYGFGEDFASAWLDTDDADLFTVTFTPTGAWDQTPGPGAGRALEVFA